MSHKPEISQTPVALVTGSRTGLGKFVAQSLVQRGYCVVGCSRGEADWTLDGYEHILADVSDERAVLNLMAHVRSSYGRLDVAINNAGIALYDDLSDRSVLEHHLAVNFFGPYAVTQAFLSLLTKSSGAIVNNVSVMALAPLPFTPAYAISKAAAFNWTQSIRALLAGQGVRVHAVLTGPTDTEMTRGFEIPKASPQSVAQAIFEGVETGEDDIFPDPMSAALAESWRTGAVKAFERESAALVAA